MGHADNNSDNSCSCQYIGKLYEHDLRGGSKHETPSDSSDAEKHTAVKLTKGRCNQFEENYFIGFCHHYLIIAKLGVANWDSISNE